MSAEAVLVLDAGTSALRAVAVTPGGAARLVGAEPWPICIPDDAAPFGREFDPVGVTMSVGRLLETAAAGEESIIAIAVTGQREGIALIDPKGAALFASPNVDARASAEGIAIDAAFGDEVYGTTGHLPSLMQIPAKIRWLRAHRPDTLAGAAYVLPFVDSLAVHITRAPAMSRSLAAENGLLDVARDTLASSLLERLDVPEALIPPLLPDGAIGGHAPGGALAGVPVVLGGADTQCALAGLGVTEPATAGIVAGWSVPIQLVTAAPVFDAQRRTWTSVHVVRGCWILESNAGETGRAWDWMRTMLNVNIDDAERLCSDAPIGCADAMSVLGPRVMRASEMGAGMGAITLPLPLVMAAPEPGHLLRSVLEATAFAIRANIEQLEEVSPSGITDLHMGGGMARSDLFAQITADVLDRPIERAHTAETTAIGAAVLAFTAVGRYRSLAEAIDTMRSAGRTFSPGARASAQYDDLYARWCALSDGLLRLGAEA